MSQPLPSMVQDEAGRTVTRRLILSNIVTVALLPVAGEALAEAADPQLDQAVKQITKGATVGSGRVKLSMPELAENGNSVSLTVSVDSPMTATDRVSSLHILSSKNPVPVIARFQFGPRAGKARLQTNVRLANTQQVVALAEMSDGSYWSGTANVIVTITACIDAG